MNLRPSRLKVEYVAPMPSWTEFRRARDWRERRRRRARGRLRGQRAGKQQGRGNSSRAERPPRGRNGPARCARLLKPAANSVPDIAGGLLAGRAVRHATREIGNSREEAAAVFFRQRLDY